MWVVRRRFEYREAPCTTSAQRESGFMHTAGLPLLLYSAQVKRAYCFFQLASGLKLVNFAATSVVFRPRSFS